MAKNISLLGADYPDVPAVVLPKTGGGSATFLDADMLGNAHIYSEEESKTTYTFNLSPFTNGKYKAALLIHHDAWNPSIYLISATDKVTPNSCYAFPVFTRNSSLTITSVSITNKVLSVTYSGTAYGGCSLIWLN